MASRNSIKVVDLYLDTKNPRQETTSQEEAVEWLCDNENIDNLAKDIVSNGLNPLELTGVFKDGEVWVVVEGNRRICALKLLIEPENSPNTTLKNKLKKYKDSWIDPIDQLECICFVSREEADIWLDRLHQGEQDGLGRSQWNATQKQRRSDSPQNKRALNVLDYALAKGWVSEEDIKEKLTTATRYLNNEQLRLALGLGESVDSVTHTRPLETFNNLVKNFINDLITSDVSGAVSSRANKDKIKDYAKSIEASNPDKTTQAETVAPQNPAKPAATKPKLKPKKPKAPPKLSINHNEKLADNLIGHGNTKLSSMYYSICMTDLNKSDYVPLVTVGAWSFVECLTKDCGRNSTDLAAFINPQLINHFDKDTCKGIKAATAELVAQGNLAKHDGTYTSFNGKSIATIMETITPFLIILLDQQIAKDAIATR
jgi:hypothetical protein